MTPLFSLSVHTINVPALLTALRFAHGDGDAVEYENLDVRLWMPVDLHLYHLPRLGSGDDCLRVCVRASFPCAIHVLGERFSLLLYALGELAELCVSRGLMSWERAGPYHKVILLSSSRNSRFDSSPSFLPTSF